MPIPLVIRLRVLPSLLVFAGMLSCASDQGRSRPAAERTPDAFASIEARASASPETPKAAPRWREVAVWTGRGASTKAIEISRDAIQWKAEWSCGSGSLRLETQPAPRDGRPIADGACPGNGLAYSVRTGPVRLSVSNPGEWRIKVSEQVTTPVDEAPLPEMNAEGAGVLKRGEFFAVERKGKGEAVVYRLPDGTLALRLEGFETSANTDLFVWASEAERPGTSREALDAPHVVLGELKSTRGNQNYPVPPDLDASRFRSVVIWCQPVQIAYVAAALGPGQ